MTAQAAQSSEDFTTSYSLTLVNQSRDLCTFYVFQTLPDQSPEVFSLIWLASPFAIAPGQEFRFDWSTDDNFVWGPTGMLSPHIGFHANGTIPADPDAANTTTLTAVPALHLTDAIPGAEPGALTIKVDHTVRSDTYAVGIGMSGKGTFLVQAEPDLTHTFLPTPIYWIGAGPMVVAQTVLDTMTKDPIEEVSFPPDVYELTYTLNKSKQWELPDS